MAVIAVALFSGCTSGRRAAGEAPAWEVERAYTGDPVTVRLRVERLQITTAQIVRVEVEVDAPERVLVRLPDPEQFADSGFQIELRTEPPALVDDGRTRHLRRYRLEPFLAGDYPIPELMVGWLAPGGEPAGLSTEALTVQVSSVLADPAVAAGPDAEALPELREVGAPIRAPLRWWRPALAGIAALAAAAAVLAVILRRRRVAASRPVPAEPPAVVALRALDELERDGALMADLDRFYVTVSSILRGYVEAQFGLRAPEQTTEEFLAAAEAGAAFDREQQRTLRAFLAACDAVKFARAQPSAAETTRITATVRGFVHATADAESVAASSAAPAAGEAER